MPWERLRLGLGVSTLSRSEPFGHTGARESRDHTAGAMGEEAIQNRSDSGIHKIRNPETDRLMGQTARLLLECNFRCPFCFAAWHEEEELPPAEVMHLVGKRWMRTISMMREQGYERITISGGEPTMHPEILKIVRHCRDVGFTSVELQTNASLLTRENTRRLVKAGVTNALVSLHSHVPETFDRITVTEGLFDTVVNGIKYLVELGVDTMISHVIISWNVEEMVDFVRFCDEELTGIREILWFSMQPEARGRHNMHLWPPLERVREQVPAALNACVERGVGYRIDSQEGYPMCFLGGHEHRVDLYDITEPTGTFGDDLEVFKVIERKKVKVPACESCFFNKACYGFWEGYFMLHGTDGIVPVERTEDLAKLFPFLDGQGSTDESLVPVRSGDDEATLDVETESSYPLPWREGRPKAQKIR